MAGKQMLGRRPSPSNDALSGATAGPMMPNYVDDKSQTTRERRRGCCGWFCCSATLNVVLVVALLLAVAAWVRGGDDDPGVVENDGLHAEVTFLFSANATVQDPTAFETEWEGVVSSHLGLRSSAVRCQADTPAPLLDEWSTVCAIEVLNDHDARAFLQTAGLDPVAFEEESGLITPASSQTAGQLTAILVCSDSAAAWEGAASSRSLVFQRVAMADSTRLPEETPMPVAVTPTSSPSAAAPLGTPSSSPSAPTTPSASPSTSASVLPSPSPSASPSMSPSPSASPSMSPSASPSNKPTEPVTAPGGYIKTNDGNFDNPIQVGTKVYSRAKDSNERPCLWVTDTETEHSRVVVHNTNAMGPFQASDGLIYWAASEYNVSTKIHLYSLDPVTEEFKLAYDFDSASSSTDSLSVILAEANGVLYVSCNAGQGREICSYDTATGIGRMVGDLYPGSASSDPNGKNLLIGDTLYFIASTPGGSAFFSINTTVVNATATQLAYQPFLLRSAAIWRGLLVHVRTVETSCIGAGCHWALYAFNGTDAWPLMPAVSEQMSWVVAGDDAYLRMQVGSATNFYHMSSMDPTVAPTLIDVNEGSSTAGCGVTNAYPVFANGLAWFSCDEVPNKNLFSFDPVTKAVKGYKAHWQVTSGNVYPIVPVGNELWVQTDLGPAGAELAIFNTTSGDVHVPQDRNEKQQYGGVEALRTIGDKAYFSRYDVFSGEQPFVYDPVKRTQTMLAAVNPDGYAGAKEFTEVGDVVAFVAYDANFDAIIMVYDPASDNVTEVSGPVDAKVLVAFHDKLYFFAKGSGNQNYFMEFDPSSWQVQELVAGASTSGDGTAREAVVCGDRLFVQADLGSDGTELYEARPDTPSLELVYDFDPGVSGSWPESLVCQNDTALLMTASISDREAYQLDLATDVVSHNDAFAAGAASVEWVEVWQNKLALQATPSGGSDSMFLYDMANSNLTECIATQASVRCIGDGWLYFDLNSMGIARMDLTTCAVDILAPYGTLDYVSTMTCLQDRVVWGATFPDTDPRYAGMQLSEYFYP